MNVSYSGLVLCKKCIMTVGSFDPWFFSVAYPAQWLLVRAFLGFPSFLSVVLSGSTPCGSMWLQYLYTLSNVLFLRYILMVNLSLFLFNLLPIVGLDGSHLFRSLLAAWKRPPLDAVYDLEALESRIAQISCLEKMVSTLAGFLVALNIVLALIQTYYRFERLY